MTLFAARIISLIYPLVVCIFAVDLVHIFNALIELWSNEFCLYVIALQW
jgi:hypothetical protein